MPDYVELGERISRIAIGLPDGTKLETHIVRGKDKKNRQEDSRDGDRESRYFRDQDYDRIAQYYGGPRNLPPGLRTKYYRTGTLPPGWQKKMQSFPSQLVRQLPPQPPNCEFGYIDGVAVVYDRKTRIILDSIDLIGAAIGR